MSGTYKNKRKRGQREEAHLLQRLVVHQVGQAHLLVPDTLTESQVCWDVDTDGRRC